MFQPSLLQHFVDVDLSSKVWRGTLARQLSSLLLVKEAELIRGAGKVGRHVSWELCNLDDGKHAVQNSGLSVLRVLYDIVCIVASHPAISFAQKQIQFSRLANYAFLFKAGDLQCKLAAAADDDDDEDDWSPEHLTWIEDEGIKSELYMIDDEFSTKLNLDTDLDIVFFHGAVGAPFARPC